MYSLTIQLNFYLIFRNIELRALRETVITEDLTFYPHTYKNMTHIKGNTDYGFRYMSFNNNTKKF